MLVVTPNFPRGTWPIGRVTAVTAEPDGVVRFTDVKVVRSSPSPKKLPDESPDPEITPQYYTRSVPKLCLLEEHQPLLILYVIHDTLLILNCTVSKDNSEHTRQHEE